MSTIIPAGQFNPAALQASGFYIAIINPPSYIRGAPTDVIGLVGTAPWGPVNTAVHLGSGQDAQLNFGPITAAALSDPYDLPTDLSMGFQQASSQASLEGWAVRVTDGTDTAGSTALAGAATAAPSTITVSGTITAGDTVTPTATSSALTGSPVAAGTYTVLVSDTTTTLATAIAAVINANAVLVAAGVFASSAAAVVTIYAPSGLSPAIVWTAPKTGSTETYTVATGSASTTGATVRAIYTGTGGNSASSNIQMTISVGVATGTFNVALVPPYGGTSELFLGLPGGNAFWAALKSALANGNSPARGASRIAIVSGAVNISVGAPTTGNKTFAGGTDGRAGVVTSTLLGSDSAMPRTGLYALRNLSPGVSIAWLTGCTDSTSFPSLLGFGQSESCCVFASFGQGISTATATAAVATNGVADPCFNYVKDWVYWLDTANKVTRLLPPTAMIASMWASYAPQNSPDNKPVNGVLGTERNPPNTSGALAYTLSEIGQLQSAGITIITNPINAGRLWGTWGGRSTSQDPATQPSEYWRMTTYLARSIASFGGKYVGGLQSRQPDDGLRMSVKAELNQFFNFLFSLGQIDSLNGSGGMAAVVLCEYSANGRSGYGWNNAASVGQHYLFAMCQVLYLSSVWFFVLSLQGGTTVNVNIIQAAPIGQAA